MKQFKAETRSYLTRYFSWASYLILIPLGAFVGTLLLGKADVFLSVFQRLFLSGDFTIIALLLSIGVVIQIYNLYDNQEIKLLEVTTSKVTAYLFNKKKIEINLKEVEKFDFTEDGLANFEFVFKDGRRQIILPTIKNMPEAYELIQENLSNLQK